MRARLATGHGAGEEEARGEQEADECEEVEEAKEARPARDPLAPTKAEKDAHEATHLPFRSWCAACVAGRRGNPPHRRMPEEEHQVPEVMLDSAFARMADDTETVTIPLTKDRGSRALRAWGDAAQRGQHGGFFEGRGGDCDICASGQHLAQGGQ